MADTLMLFGGIGPWEVAVVGVVLLLIFGSRLPEVMRSMGRSVTEFKKGLRETNDELRDMQDEITDTEAGGERKKVDDRAAK